MWGPRLTLVIASHFVPAAPRVPSRIWAGWRECRGSGLARESVEYPVENAAVGPNRNLAILQDLGWLGRVLPSNKRPAVGLIRNLAIPEDSGWLAGWGSHGRLVGWASWAGWLAGWLGWMAGWPAG